MQLYERGLIGLDDPVQKYLSGFNAGNDPRRAKVTVRMLLTHTSGEAPDVELRDPWGLARADRAEGFRRALTAPLQSGPGEAFRYSDMNFILLGALLETITGQAEDVYVERNIFEPLGMTDTRYLPLAKACGPHTVRGVAIAWAPARNGVEPSECTADTWSTDLLSRIAPTAHDDEGSADPRSNPDFDQLLRGAVHDTTTRRMGGVAGHAGVFSTAHDVGVFAQGLLDRLAGRPSNFPLERTTVELMTTPQQPGHTPHQARAADDASRAAIATKPNAVDPLLAPRYPAINGQNLRGFGWDIDTSFSQARGMVFPIGSFGHTGFTGTTIWVDPASDSYVIVLANAIHPRGNRPINKLRGNVATVTARALGLGAVPPR
jgi:CubicO group peptidase (beta-lactamase class C family)